jgi:hypothetical protein
MDLESIGVADAEDGLSWGEITAGAGMPSFKACGSDDTLILAASSTAYRRINDEIQLVASSSEPAAPILGAFVGKIASSSGENSSSTDKKQGFSVTDLVALVPNGICP